MTNQQAIRTTIANDIQWITRRHPWIGRVLNLLPKEYTDTLPDGSPNETMATNGKALFINPAFALSLPDGERQGVLVHEAIHVIQRHPLRRGNRDPQLYGIAIDAATNHLVGRMFYRLPEDCIEPVGDQTVEQIYADLAAQQPEQQPEDGSTEGATGQDGESQPGGDAGEPTEGQGEPEQGNGPADDEGGDAGDNQQPVPGKGPQGDDCLDYPLEPGQTLADAEREIDTLVAQAQMESELAGDSPSAVEADTFESVDSELNWPKELEDFVQLTGGSEYSMNPPHVGLAQQGIICNQLNPSGCGNVVVAIDVSGSIDMDKLNLALTHLTLFVENIDYESLRVIACNTRVQFDETFYRGEPVDITGMRKGGGTRFQPIFDLIDEGATPDLLVFFSDMQSTDTADMEDPGYPIVWLVDHYSLIDASGDWKPCGGYWTPDFGHRIDARQ